MADIFGITTAASTYGANITSALGLTGWQLKTGKYNGCSFATFVQIPILENNAIYKSGQDLVAVYDQAFGTLSDGADRNAKGQLYNTIMGLIQFSDKLVTGTVEKQTPYANSVNIEDVGFKGYEFKMSLVFFGDDYMKALANFENAVLNPPKIATQYLKLEHPTRGVIDGYTYVVGGLEVITSLAYWRGCIVNVTFRSTTTPSQVKSANSNVTNVIRTINAALGVVNGLGATIATINGTISNFKSNGVISNNSSVTTSAQVTQAQYNTLSTNLTSLSTAMFNAILYMYKYGKTGTNIASLNSATLDYSYLPKSLNQQVSYKLNQGSIIMAEYYAQCQAIVDEIATYNLQGLANDIVNEIRKSISALGAVCEVIGNKKTTSTYTTPYDMSIRRVLSINGLPLNKAQTVMDLNPDILSANYIAANTVVNLI